MPADIEDIILGCAFPEGEQGLNVARLIGLLADLPLSVGGMTVNRFCGSSMQAIHIAAGADRDRRGRGVHLRRRREHEPRADGRLQPAAQPRRSHAKHPGAYMGMGETAENVAQQVPDHPRRAGSVRGDAASSKAAAAQAAGKFDDEIVPIQTKGGMVDQDGCIRARHHAGGARRPEAGLRRRTAPSPPAPPRR